MVRGGRAISAELQNLSKKPLHSAIVRIVTVSLCLALSGACLERPRVSDERRPESRVDEGGRADDERVLLRLGVVARSDPRLTVSGSRPLAEYLSRKAPYRVELRVGRSAEEIELDVGIQDLVTFLEERLVEIAPLGALSYCLADARFGAVPLVQTLNEAGEPRERGAFVVSEDSASIRTLDDLRERSLALGPSHSSTSHLLALHELEKAGLAPESLTRADNLESDEAVVAAVRSGRYDAGAVSELTLEEEMPGLRVLHRFEPIPSRALVVRRDLPIAVQDSLRTALLEIGAEQSTDRSDWGPLFRNGFAPASDGDYASIRRIANEQSARCARGCHEPVHLEKHK